MSAFQQAADAPDNPLLEECPICYVDYLAADLVRCRPAGAALVGHIICKTCFSKANKKTPQSKNTQCPQCRADFQILSDMPALPAEMPAVNSWVDLMRAEDLNANSYISEKNFISLLSALFLLANLTDEEIMIGIVTPQRGMRRSQILPFIIRKYLLDTTQVKRDKWLDHYRQAALNLILEKLVGIDVERNGFSTSFPVEDAIMYTIWRYHETLLAPEATLPRFFPSRVIASLSTEDPQGEEYKEYDDLWKLIPCKTDFESILDALTDDMDVNTLFNNHSHATYEFKLNPATGTYEYFILDNVGREMPFSRWIGHADSIGMQNFHPDFWYLHCSAYLEVVTPGESL